MTRHVFHNSYTVKPAGETDGANSMKITHEIVTKVEGKMSEVLSASPAATPTLADVLQTMKELAFVVETIAHLQGRERDLLPIADKARAQILALEGRESRVNESAVVSTTLSQ